MSPYSWPPWCGACCSTASCCAEPGQGLWNLRPADTRLGGRRGVALQYDTEHVMLRDSAEKLLAERYDYRTFQKIADSDAGWSPEIWAEFARLGWLGLPFAP